MISSTYPSWVTAESLQKDDTAEHQAALNKLIIEVRAKLDTGIGQKILQEAWSSVTRHFFEGEPIFAAALLLRAGAKISPGDLKHLRKLAEKIEPPSVKNMNVGLCGPGRAQFMAALDSYKHGIPRNFCEPSCFCCGKTEVDTGRPPFSCKSCKDKGLEGWYCDRACQKKDWQQHKKTCGKPTGVTKAF
ncbi:hypothetical protein QBC41DRAFT_224255 [Cercophora samala]|uniref:MYND-type domain-containing protein n=1 Tax=Cercophora samala TaxID=330535 RepID=A0AA39ZEW8_9PEZI|nr:hypothetical protein QBC41DRAFT_224255 [Cercophora samala]